MNANHTPLIAEYRLVSAIMPRTPSTVPFRVVLHESARPGELVTHLQNTDTNEYFWGHYFTDGDAKANAIEDYLGRCRKYGLEPLAGCPPGTWALMRREIVREQ